MVFVPVVRPAQRQQTHGCECAIVATGLSLRRNLINGLRLDCGYAEA